MSKAKPVNEHEATTQLDSVQQLIPYYERIADSLEDDHPKNAGQALSDFIVRAASVASNYQPTGLFPFKATQREPHK